MNKTKVTCLKKLFNKLFGIELQGNTVCDVLVNVDTPKEMLLKSSTADSEKLFKITVIDDGTLTATEVTENS